MPEPRITWSIVVDQSTDLILRRYLANIGARKGAISRFVELAVREKLLALARSEGMA